MEELTRAERNAKIRAQLAAWRDSFIEATVKNNMLNQNPLTTNAVKFDVTEAFTYERFWEMATGEGNAEEYALKSNAFTVPGTKPIAWRAERGGATEPVLLENLVSHAYKSIVQKGENPLCQIGRAHV